MKNYRESRQRGTPDLPLARYSFQFDDARRITANTHWHPEQEILYVTAGALEVLIGKRTFLVSAGQICFVPPHAMHSITTAVPHTAYHAFVFSYDLLTLPESHFFQASITAPLKRGQLTLPPLLGSDHIPQAAKALEQLSRCAPSDPDYKFTVFQILVNLYSALRNTLIPADNRKSDSVNRAVKTCLDYMHAHYQEKITLEQLAQLVHLHPNYLCKLFKVYTGQTAIQHLSRIRLEQASSLLENQSCTVAQAANLCGFESVSFFSRSFHRQMGVTPKAYQLSHAK